MTSNEVRDLEVIQKVHLLDNHIHKYINKYREHPYYLAIYTVTITPKGKNKTHEETLAALQVRLNKISSIRAVYLVREAENTNHFHGLILLKQKSKLIKLYNKRNYDIRIRLYNNTTNDWIKYIMKGNPDYMDIYTGHNQNNIITQMELK